MKLISHRGNVNGPLESWENEPTYIDLAISKGYDVEIDVWYVDGFLYLGHDKPQYGVTYKFFQDRITKLWIHCKNVEALKYFQEHDVLKNTHYFWHQEDDIALTSFNIFWTYPNKPLTEHSVCVMPELHNQDVPDFVYGICSDYIENFKNKDVK
jgi:hypothetical protein